MVGVVVVNRNSKKQLFLCVKSLMEANYWKECLLVVIDNNSTDTSLLLVKESFPDVTIIEMKENAGYAKANNMGISYLLRKGVQYVFILNPDTRVEKNAIKTMIDLIRKNKKVGIVGPKIYSQERKIWSAGGVIDVIRYSGGLVGLGESDHGQFNHVKEVDFISGTAMFVRKEVFNKIGLLPEDYFIYYEDVDFCMQARKEGFRLLFMPKAVIYHEESSYFGKNSPAHQYYMARNHLYFEGKYAPLVLQIREFFRLPKTISEHIQKKEMYALIGIRDYFLRRRGKHDYWS